MKNRENLGSSDPFLELIAELRKNGGLDPELSTDILTGQNQAPSGHSANGAASPSASQRQPRPEVSHAHRTAVGDTHYTRHPTPASVGLNHTQSNGSHSTRQPFPEDVARFINTQASRITTEPMEVLPETRHEVPAQGVDQAVDHGVDQDTVSPTTASAQSVRQTPLDPLLQQQSVSTQQQRSVGGNSSGEAVQSNIWRDPMDAATIQRQSQIIILQAVALVIVTGICIYLVRRVPDRIVIDRSSGRVVQINNRDYGSTEAVEMTPDKPGVPDRIYLAKTWCDWFFTIDRATRAKQLERVFALMEPAGRRALARWLQERGELDTERAESWQAIWKVLDAQADRRDPYLIRILGEQQISRLTHQANISSGLQTFRRQITITLKLVADPEGRADRNLRTGYLVAWVDARQVGADEPVSQNPVQSAGSNQADQPTQGNTPATQPSPAPTDQPSVPKDGSSDHSAS